MENNMKINNQISLIQKQVDQIQLKVFKEKKNKWYKTPSLILSIIALFSSLLFSVISTLNQQEEKQSSIIEGIKESISELVNEEEKLLQISSNQQTDQASKNSAFMSFQAKSGYLIDKISKSINTKNIDKLEPNLLVSYGRFLYNSSKYKLSKEIYEKIIQKTNDTSTIGICYRSLANIYANPSFSHFDSLKSRKYRKKDIELTKSYKGEMKNDYLSRSYELWAIDEYYFLKNKEEGNRLIDSAKFYIRRFPDLNVNKMTIMNRLDETYNFYNDILVPSKISGEYILYCSDGKKGKGYISINSFGSKLSLDFLKNNKLHGRLSGNGNLINMNEVKYDVRLETVDEFNNTIYSAGTLTLKTIKNQKLVGYLYEFNKKPIKYYLSKKL